MMRIATTLLFVLAAAIPILSSCDSRTAEQRRQAALQKIDATEREIQADLMRAKANCMAEAYEFQTSPDDCIQAYRAQLDSAQQSLADLEKRRRELAKPAPYLSKNPNAGIPGKE